MVEQLDRSVVRTDKNVVALVKKLAKMLELREQDYSVLWVQVCRLVVTCVSSSSKRLWVNRLSLNNHLWIRLLPQLQWLLHSHR